MLKNMLFHTQGIPKQHVELIRIFFTQYHSMCQHMDDVCQEELAKLAPLVFGKWYVSALIEETLLSPANILNLDLENDMQSEVAYAIQYSETESDTQHFSVSRLSYSHKKHPFIDDLAFLVNYCVPDCNMDEHLFFCVEDRKIIAKSLSQSTDFYIEYLTRIAWRLELLTYMPAIHVKKVQKSPSANDFFAQSAEDILRQIIDAACELSAERFTVSMDLEFAVVNANFFLQLLTKPAETDEIFLKFYERVDVDIETIWKKDITEMNEDERAIVSSFVFTGIMLDKWFLFPMANFFHLIRPITYNAIKFHPLVNSLAALLIMEHNTGAEIFTPPIYYTLSPLGDYLYGTDYEENKKFIMPKAYDIEEVLELVEKELRLYSFEQVFYSGPTPEIIRMKITRTMNENLWKILEIPLQFDLDEFCMDLFLAFGIESENDYLLCIPNEHNFPMDYSPKGSKKSVNKTNGKVLKDLELETGTIFTLVPSVGKKFGLQIEVLEQKEGNPHLIYPRVTLQSAEISALEKFDEIF